MIVMLGDVIRQETCGVVARGLDGSGAVGRGPVIGPLDHGVHGFDAALVIGAHGHDHDDEFILFAGVDADLGRSAEHHRTDVEGTAGAVGRHIVGVVGHDGLDRFNEIRHREGRHHEAAGGVGHAFAVFLGPEDPEFAVLAAEGLESFEDRLPVVQHIGGDGKIDGVLTGKFPGIPGAVGVVETDVAPRGHELKSEFFPFDVHLRIPPNYGVKKISPGLI